MNRLRQFGMVALASTGMAFAAAASADAGATTWNVAKDASSVKFSATQEGSKFTGKFADFTAQIAFDPDHPMQGKIVGMVRTASVDTGDSERDSQLPDADWFAAKQYPEAKFESKSVEKAPSGGYVADGELTLKGKTQPMKMPFTFEKVDANTAMFHGTMTIDRFKYNVGESFSDSSFVGQNVDVVVTLKLTK